MFVTTNGNLDGLTRSVKMFITKLKINALHIFFIQKPKVRKNPYQFGKKNIEKVPKFAQSIPTKELLEVYYQMLLEYIRRRS